MKHLLIITSLTILMMLLFARQVNAQSTRNIHEARNNINIYIGIFDLNLNYERNIIKRPKSLSNIRAGFGRGQFVVAGEGCYVNGAFVQLFGAGSSHLELNAGLKYMITNSESNPPLSDQLLPDIFVGYRYQKPTGGIILRYGLNYPTLINVGVGYQF